MEVPDDLMHHIDGFLGLIVHRGDTDQDQAHELLNRVKKLTRRPPSNRCGYVPPANPNPPPGPPAPPTIPCVNQPGHDGPHNHWPFVA